jgi:hypothetical protein
MHALRNISTLICVSISMLFATTKSGEAQTSGDCHYCQQSGWCMLYAAVGYTDCWQPYPDLCEVSEVWCSVSGMASDVTITGTVAGAFEVMDAEDQNASLSIASFAPLAQKERQVRRSCDGAIVRRQMSAASVENLRARTRLIEL